jgi:2-keto-3-deoxy-L-fuconate dehydrogenase
VKRALVTGAGSGIGAAVAQRLASDGLDVVRADVRDAGQGGLILDVRDEAQVAPAMRDLDVLVNVAGIGSTTNAPDTPLEVWDDVFAVNARGTFLCCKHAIPGMAARGGGSIVNVASIAALVGLRNRAAYCASKGAVVALTRATRRGCAGSSTRQESRSTGSARASRWAGSGRPKRSRRPWPTSFPPSSQRARSSPSTAV